MAYTIHNTNGNILATVADGTVNSVSSSITLVGKNYSGYGQFLNEDLVHLLENFANKSAPTAPLAGQLWFNSSVNTLSVYTTNSSWAGLAVISAGASTPSNPTIGNQWWNPVAKQFNVYDGTGWTLVGPVLSVASANVANFANNTNSLGNVAASNYVQNNSITSVTIANTTNSTSSTTGALIVTGGVGIGEDLYVYGSIVGTSTKALYADVAERFSADSEYKPGTVVALGGIEEITLCNDELSDEVFGVISTQPAHLMNSGAGDDSTHPPVAISGRVPVTVIGKVKKGDRLVSAGNGLARAGAKSEITQFNVIGRALETKENEGIDSILAIVKLNS
jgi:hypothetical protein